MIREIVSLTASCLRATIEIPWQIPHKIPNKDIIPNKDELGLRIKIIPKNPIIEPYHKFLGIRIFNQTNITTGIHKEPEYWYINASEIGIKRII